MIETRTNERDKKMSWLLGPGVLFQIEVPSSDGWDWRRVEVPEGKQVIVGRGNLRRVGTCKVGQGITLGEGFKTEGIYVAPGIKVRITFPQKGIIMAPKLTKDENRY